MEIPEYGIDSSRITDYRWLRWKWKSLSHVQLFVTPWTIQSMEFSRLEYWRILQYSSDPFSRGSSQPRSPTLQADSLPAESQGKPKNTEMGSLFLLQRIFLIQELKQDFLHCRSILYKLSFQGSGQVIKSTRIIMRDFNRLLSYKHK